MTFSVGDLTHNSFFKYINGKRHDVAKMDLLALFTFEGGISDSKSVPPIFFFFFFNTDATNAHIFCTNSEIL